jgi:RNA polymerase sigma-70 factor, ECF subfamily
MTTTIPFHSVEIEVNLVQRVLGGDQEAFYELVRPCERGVYLAALGVVGNEADAEEVAQEAVLKAFKNLPRFRQESKFSTWLIQIAINEARMRLRKNRPHLYESIEEGSPTEDGSYMPKEYADWREIPSQALETRQLREAIRDAIMSLPEKYRSVFVLRDVQQLSIGDTAKALNITEANVKTRLSRARLRMREALAPGWGGEWSRTTAQPKECR